MLGGEAYYCTNKHEAPAGDKTNLYGASGWIGYRFGQPQKPGVFVMGSAGGLKHDYRSTAFPAEQGGNFEFAWSVGAGALLPIGGAAEAFVESRYMARGDTSFIPIFVGVSIGVGKKA